MKKNDHIYIILLLIVSLVLAYFLGYDMYVKTRPIVFGLLSAAIGLHINALYKETKKDKDDNRKTD